MRTRLEILSSMDALLNCMARINKEAEHVQSLMAKYKGYYEFRGSKRLDALHKAFSIVNQSVDELRQELYSLPYEVWLTTSNGNTSRIARGFDTIASAEAWIARINHGQGRFDIYHIS